MNALKEEKWLKWLCYPERNTFLYTTGICTWFSQLSKTSKWEMWTIATDSWWFSSVKLFCKHFCWQCSWPCLSSSSLRFTSFFLFWLVSSHRKGRHGDVRAEPGGDGPLEEAGRRDPPPAVRGDLGTLRRDPVPPQRHWEPAGAAHLRHSHAAEHVQVTGPGGGASRCKQRDECTSYLTQMECGRAAQVLTPGRSTWTAFCFSQLSFCFSSVWWVFVLTGFWFLSGGRAGKFCIEPYAETKNHAKWSHPVVFQHFCNMCASLTMRP